MNLTPEQLEKLTTPRLLALKKKLHKLRYEQYYPEEDDPRDQILLIKEILSNRGV